YLAFLGRISPEKRVDRAIMIAQSVGLPLRIAAKVDRVDETYFRSEIEPLLGLPGVEYIGEIDDRRKSQFLGEACALLFPVDWPEPFGLAMIEAMACGTPVLAFRNGAVAEVIEDGVTGYVVDSMDEAIGKLGSVLALDRGRVRRRFEERLSGTRMAHDYVKIYTRLIGKRAVRADLAPPAMVANGAETAAWQGAGGDPLATDAAIVDPRHAPADARVTPRAGGNMSGARAD